MKSKASISKIIREKLEERVKFFLDIQLSKKYKNDFTKLDANDKQNSPTIKDSLIHSEKGRQTIEKIQKNNNINHLDKKNANISSLSTQIQAANDLYINYSSNKKENQTIPIKKELLSIWNPVLN